MGALHARLPLDSRVADVYYFHMLIALSAAGGLLGAPVCLLLPLPHGRQGKWRL